MKDPKSTEISSLNLADLDVEELERRMELSPMLALDATAGAEEGCGIGTPCTGYTVNCTFYFPKK